MALQILRGRQLELRARLGEFGPELPLVPGVDVSLGIRSACPLKANVNKSLFFFGVWSSFCVSGFEGSGKAPEEAAAGAATLDVGP